jgi:hypothetical protein
MCSFSICCCPKLCANCCDGFLRFDRKFIDVHFTFNLKLNIFLTPAFSKGEGAETV